MFISPVNRNHVLSINMILLKKPYTPVVFTSATNTFSVYGKSFVKITNVYLSGAPYENTTFYNPFSSVAKLSAHYPGFFGVKLLSSTYTTNNDNTISFTMPSATLPGFVDIIVENPAGYGKLTQYVIKNLYSGVQDLSTLRPWAHGIKVTKFEESQFQPLFVIITDNNDILITDTGDTITYG